MVLLLAVVTYKPHWRQTKPQSRNFYDYISYCREKLVLQDLPSVIDDIKESHGYIVEMKYDLSTPQPVNDLSIPFLPSASRILFPTDG
jgi:hypothetical protein